MRVISLKPCPFCGAAADFEEIAGKAHSGVDFSVGCFTDGCFGYQSYLKLPTKGEAADAWNTRVDSSVPQNK